MDKPQWAYELALTHWLLSVYAVMGQCRWAQLSNDISTKLTSKHMHNEMARWAFQNNKYHTLKLTNKQSTSSWN